MRATRRSVAATLMVVVALLLAACEPTPPPAVARVRGAAWLVNQFGDDGVIAASFDPNLDDLGGTAYAVTNLAVARVGRASGLDRRDALRARATRLGTAAPRFNSSGLCAPSTAALRRRRAASKDLTDTSIGRIGWAVTRGVSPRSARPAAPCRTRPSTAGGSSVEAVPCHRTRHPPSPH